MLSYDVQNLSKHGNNSGIGTLSNQPGHQDIQPSLRVHGALHARVGAARCIAGLSNKGAQALASFWGQEVS